MIHKIRYGYYLLLAILLLTGSSAFAQKGTESIPWKKQVIRLIDIAPQNSDTTRSPKDPAKDSTLLGRMLSVILRGKVIAYNNVDNYFITELPANELGRMVGIYPDTVVLTDPVTNEERKAFSRRNCDLHDVHRYRILEDWTFIPLTGSTDIKIVGIAPEWDVYSDVGDLRGVQAIFWLRYSDAWPILERYERANPASGIAKNIWADYFTQEGRPHE